MIVKRKTQLIYGLRFCLNLFRLKCVKLLNQGKKIGCKTPTPKAKTTNLFTPVSPFFSCLSFNKSDTIHAHAWSSRESNPNLTSAKNGVLPLNYCPLKLGSNPPQFLSFNYTNLTTQNKRLYPAYTCQLIIYLTSNEIKNAARPQSLTALFY